MPCRVPMFPLRTPAGEFSPGSGPRRREKKSEYQAASQRFHLGESMFAFPGSFLRIFFVRACAPENISERIIPFMTRVFENGTFRHMQRSLYGPRLGERRWIVHGEFVHYGFRIDYA